MQTRIRELRQEKHMSQKYLAGRIGVSQTTLSKIEKGTTTPDALLLVSLSRFFQVSTDYILCLSDERISADELLLNNMHNFKQYKRIISMYQKMNSNQRDYFYAFLSSMFGETDGT